MRTFDHVVIGHGLAGAAVAWHLLWEGGRVLVIDGGAPGSASRIAAGLITPITGRRLAKTWRFDDCFPAAVRFYRRVETETGSRLLETQNAVRLFASAGERADFIRRTDHAAVTGCPGSLVNEDWFAATWGGFEIAPAARLDVSRYLDSSREYLIAGSSFRAENLDLARDLRLVPDGVVLPRLGVRAGQVIFCQGYAARDNPWFRTVRFTPAKGELLTVRVPGVGEHRVVHRGVWIAPLGGDLFRVGATYDRDDLTPAPSPRGRDELAGRLREFLRLPFEVVDHSAGVRPVVEGGRPVLGVHPDYPRLAFFNGLGSKGSLLAPFFAAQLVSGLTHRRLIEPDVDFLRTRKTVVSPRVVDLAHAEIRAVLRPGEVAVDATAGNGRDTVFLADLVGPAGRVYALDVQELALRRTSALLQQRGYCNVTLIHRDHAELADALPAECHRGVGAVMFNPGDLPGGDKSAATSPRSTRAAIRAALTLLRPGGVMTVVAYPGHPGGADELADIRGLLGSDQGAGFDAREMTTGRPTGPLLFVVRARGTWK